MPQLVEHLGDFRREALLLQLVEIGLLDSAIDRAAAMAPARFVRSLVARRGVHLLQRMLDDELRITRRSLVAEQSRAATVADQHQCVGGDVYRFHLGPPFH
jgi:hypothetical protein